ncbi:MAG: DUF308 domain-containing protein [Terriglobales bacterium]
MSDIPIPIVVKKSLGWSVLMSILMIVAGILASLLPFVAGIAVNVFVGWMLIFSGGALVVFAWHTRGAGGVVWELLLAGLYLFIGGFILFRPLLGLASLTLALSIYLLVEAALEFALAFRLRSERGWGWLLFDGIITLILAFLIWRTWPSSSEWAIGTLVGISILLSGISRLMLSLAARRVINTLV